MSENDESKTEERDWLSGDYVMLIVCLFLGAAIVVPALLVPGSPMTLVLKLSKEVREIQKEQRRDNANKKDRGENLLKPAPSVDVKQWASDRLNLPAGYDYLRMRPSRDRTRAVICAYGKAVFVDLEEMKVTRQMENISEDGENAIEAILYDYSFPRERFVTADRSQVHVIDADSKDIVQTLQLQRDNIFPDNIHLVRLFPGGNRVLVHFRGRHQTVNKIEVDSWLEVWRIDGVEPAFVTRLTYRPSSTNKYAEFSSDGKYLAVTQKSVKQGDKYVVKIRNAKDPEEYWKLPVTQVESEETVHFRFQKMRNGTEWLGVYGDKTVEGFPLSHIEEEQPSQWHMDKKYGHKFDRVFPDGSHLLTRGGNFINLYALPEAPRRGRIKKTNVMHDMINNGVCDTMLGKDGDTFYVLTGRGTLLKLSKRRLLFAVR